MLCWARVMCGCMINSAMFLENLGWGSVCPACLLTVLLARLLPSSAVCVCCKCGVVICDPKRVRNGTACMKASYILDYIRVENGVIEDSWVTEMWEHKAKPKWQIIKQVSLMSSIEFLDVLLPKKMKDPVFSIEFRCLASQICEVVR